MRKKPKAVLCKRLRSQYDNASYGPRRSLKRKFISFKKAVRAGCRWVKQEPITTDVRELNKMIRLSK
jgi:hypothetical protein